MCIVSFADFYDWLYSRISAQEHTRAMVSRLLEIILFGNGRLQLGNRPGTNVCHRHTQ